MGVRGLKASCSFCPQEIDTLPSSVISFYNSLLSSFTLLLSCLLVLVCVRVSIWARRNGGVGLHLLSNFVFFWRRAHRLSSFHFLSNPPSFHLISHFLKRPPPHHRLIKHQHP